MNTNKVASPTARLIFGIIFIVLSVFSLFQSLGVMAAFSIASYEEGASSGALGIIVSIMMLVLGIILVSARKNDSKGITITIYIIGILAAVFAFLASAEFTDMSIYAVALLAGTFFSALKLSKTKNIKTNNTVKKEQPSPTDELTKFKKLLDDGVITQEEFDKQKKKILDL